MIHPLFYVEKPLIFVDDPSQSWIQQFLFADNSLLFANNPHLFADNLFLFADKSLLFAISM